MGFKDDPEEVVADAALTSTLHALSERLAGALALVSGRSVASLDRLFAPYRFAAAGGHGAEVRFDDGSSNCATGSALPDSVLSALSAFAAVTPGVLVEEKVHGAALHYRMAPDKMESCRDFMRNVASALGDEYRLVTGKMVVEVAAAGCDKGTGLLSLLGGGVFAGRRPVFVGDDDPDESAFRAVNELDGTSVRVGHSSSSEAQYFLDDVSNVRKWLERALAVSQH